jgi:SAM-dependent MidA family methyltransferase
VSLPPAFLLPFGTKYGKGYSMSLSEIIIEKIHKEGPMSFHDFMDTSLYYPREGYYTSPGNKIGSDGDYFTSPTLSSLFGVMIAKQLEEMWDLLGKQQFTIIEYGAGTGKLCNDILNELKSNRPMFKNIHYCIIEKSSEMQRMEYKNVTEKDKVSWHHSIHEMQPVTGCIISNEVLDNFPVHSVVMEDELMEVFVNYEDGFAESLMPASRELKDYLIEMDIALPKGYRTEINLEAKKWIEEIASALAMGFVLTIDYGYTSQELYTDGRRLGTLMCYHKHDTNDLPYAFIGEQDITAHVNFSALLQWGNKSGLQPCGFTDQSHFLRALGLTSHLRKIENQKGDNSNSLAQALTLLTSMGNKFKVLIQQKGLADPHLSGMMFSEQVY